jgi:hypothetical protein
MAVEYKMVDAVTLSNFRRFMASGVPLREFGVQGAFDSKPSRRARDEEGMPESRGDIARMMKTIARGMSPENWAKWREELLDDGAEDGEYTTPEERADSESFPNAKKATAMDAMAFDKLATPRSTKADKTFAAMYPGAGDIKINSDSYPNMSRVRT